MKIFLLGLFLALGVAQGVFGQNPEFVLVKKEDNIFIYERWITFPKTNPPIEAREVKGEFYFNNSIREGIRLLQNEQKIKKWQSHVSEFKVYKQADTTTWFEYSYHDIPWPVSDQDHVLVYQVSRDNPREIFITFESIINDTIAPVRKGVTRMTLSGSWTFEKISSDRVKATYRILSMPMNIPRFLTDPIIRNNMMSTIQEFIVLIDRSKQKK
jgi:hypothetical protein